MACCTYTARGRCRDAAAQLDTLPVVEDTNVLPPSTDPTNRWTLEIVVDCGQRGVPSAVTETIADARLDLWSVDRQGQFRTVVACA